MVLCKLLLSANPENPVCIGPPWQSLPAEHLARHCDVKQQFGELAQTSAAYFEDLSHLVNRIQQHLELSEPPLSLESEVYRPVPVP